MPRKIDAFLCLNRHVPKIADMVNTDHLFTFQDINKKKKISSKRHCFQRCRTNYCISLNTIVKKKKEGIRKEEFSGVLASRETALICGQGFVVCTSESKTDNDGRDRA